MHEQTIIILKALADPTRLDIVRRLVREKDGASCGEVSACSSLSQPAMSHHFGKLAEAGVVLEHKEGKEKFYELNTDLLASHGIDPQKL
jgi:ArsR family transcriptional regulator